jgi:hypothetical protein
MQAEAEVCRAGAMPSDRKAPLRAQFAKVLAVCAIGLGVAATITWTIVLGWLLMRAVRMLL